MTWGEYLLDHPDAEPQPEAERARRSLREPTPLPHWEPLWTQEYVLDRLSAWHETGAEMNHLAMAAQDIPLMNSVRRWWPEHTYDELLTKIGLNAADIRRYDDYATITPDMIVQKIQQRHAVGLPLTPNKMCHGQHADWQTYYLGMRLFESWPTALRTAGLDAVAASVFKPRFTSGQMVLDEILRRQAAGLSILHGPVTRSDGALAASAYHFFGSWNGALQALNIIPDTLSVQRAARIEWWRKKRLASLSLTTP